MSLPPRTAIVVGASISGLACALQLCKLGFQVTLFEASHGQHWRREIVNVPPNMSRILNSWGLDLGPISVQLEGMMFRDNGDKDQLVGFLDIPPEMISDLGADYYYAHYAEYYHVLMEMATRAGTHVQMGSHVHHVHLGTGLVSFRSEDKTEERTQEADLVVVASGTGTIPVLGGMSSVSEGTTDQEPSEEARVGENYLSLVGHLTAQDKRHLQVSDLDNASRATFWMAPHGTVCYIPMSSGEVEVFVRYRLDVYNEREERLQEVPAAFYETLPPRVQAIVKCAHVGTPRKEPTNAVCGYTKSDRVVFVGEAAHPWLPNGTHRHAMGVEDVATLGRLLSLKIPIDAAIAAYHTIRLERWTAALVSDRGKLDYSCLPPGKEQEERNGVMKLFATLANADDGTLFAVFEEYLRFFNYDAVEAVDEWWNIARHSPVYH